MNPEVEARGRQWPWGWSSAKGARGMGCREGVSPPHWKRDLGRGYSPLPENF